MIEWLGPVVTETYASTESGMVTAITATEASERPGSAGRPVDGAVVWVLDGLITLGDMGYLDAEGYLYLCDRASDMVVSGGVNIYPAEIEHALLHCPGVLDCAVFGMPGAEFGERLHAVVQPEAGVCLDTAAIAARLRSELAGFKVPRRIEVVTTLPRDDNGKSAKRRLRAAHWEGRTRRI